MGLVLVTPGAFPNVWPSLGHASPQIIDQVSSDEGHLNADQGHLKNVPMFGDMDAFIESRAEANPRCKRDNALA